MALASQLTRRSAPPELLTVTATASLDEVEGKNRIVAGALAVEVFAPTLSDDELETALHEAGERCPFSALLRDAGAIVTATLRPGVRS
jgi:organic hydroperoxide reductase OsmC/OhrA